MEEKKTWAQRVVEERPENGEPMPDSVKKALAEWIANTYKPAKTVWRGHTSYGEKHRFQQDTRIYVTNSQFKWAMQKAGYEPKTEDEINWEYYMRLQKKR